MTAIKFFIAAHPEPCGSKKGFIVQRKGTPGTSRKDFMAVVVDANAEAEEWKEIVRASAKKAYSGTPMAGPMQLDMTFHAIRPKSHYGTGRNASILKGDAPQYPTSKPDALKLARGVEDALTEIIYEDDAQIVAEHIFKVYGPREGVDIAVAPYEETLF